MLLKQRTTFVEKKFVFELSIIWKHLKTSYSKENVRLKGPCSTLMAVENECTLNTTCDFVIDWSLQAMWDNPSP